MVNKFRVKYLVKENPYHFIQVLCDLYVVSMDCLCALFSIIKIKRDQPGKISDIYMDACINDTIHKL